MPRSLIPLKTSDRYQQRHDATWQDYTAVRDSDEIDGQKISFDQGWLWVDMEKDGPNHASFRDLYNCDLFCVGISPSRNTVAILWTLFD